MNRLLRSGGIALLLTSYACSGSISCTACGSGPLDPIPGGFPANAQIERAAQVRVTQGGLDFIETEFQSLIGAFVELTCEAADDPPCPTGFQDLNTGAANPSTCDTGQGVCVEQLSGDPGPLMGFEVENQVTSGATICRDDVNDPNRRDCFAYIRFEDLALVPMGPNQVEATIVAQIYTTPIPFRYDPLGMDCLVTLDSGADGSALQDIVIVAELNEWNAPSGMGGRQLDVDIVSVDAQIPDGDVSIERDPVHGGLDDTLTCALGNLATVKNILIPQLTGSLGDLVGEEVDKATGWRCGGAMTQPCPAQTTCNSDNYCEEDATGDLVPVNLGMEGRLDLGSLLGGFTNGRPGQGDISFLLGGPSTADTGGLTLGALGGAEVVTPDPSCAMVLPSPRTRPGFAPPPALPTDDTVDLDFDGTPETTYMVAAGISEALADQYLWSVYTTGLFCTSVSASDVGVLNTGTLGLLMPSLGQLTHRDKYDWAIYPAMITLFPGAEPEIVFGSGEITGPSDDPTLVDPLLSIRLPDMRIGFFAMVEDRWVQLMVLELDFALSLGAMVTPNNEIQLVIGDVTDSIQNVRISENEILAEDPQELEDAIPALLNFALPNITGALPPFALPTAADLGGFELNVLGIRGVQEGVIYPNVAVYADLGFDASQVPNLSLASETSATVLSVDYSDVKRPAVALELAAFAPAGEVAEFQYRVDGGLWSLFFSADEKVVQRPELGIQGWHQIEVRSRVKGQYKTLDPSPVRLDVLIDAEAPRLSARLVEGGLEAEAFDTASAVRLEVMLDGETRPIEPGFTALDNEGEVVVAAIDEAGHRTEVQLGRGAPVTPEPEVEAASSCTCAKTQVRGSGLLLFLGLVLLGVGRRRRCV